MLYGERVILRAMRYSDLETLCRFNNDLEVELAGGGDPPFPQALERLQSDFGNDAGKGGRDGTRFAIECDGKLIGNCALFSFDGVNRTCALGITIGDKEYWGKGYGREALRLLIEYGFRFHNVRKVWLNVYANNERGIRSYNALGFVEEGRMRQHVWSNGEYVDLLYMGLLREEFKGSDQ